MPSGIYNVADWYWNVAAVSGFRYSSAAAAYVADNAAVYFAWVAAGNTTSQLATEAELWAVLAQQYPAGIATSNSTGLEAIRVYRVSVLWPNINLGSVPPLLQAPEYGYCLFVNSTTSLGLPQRGSGRIFINGINYDITSTAPAISNSGLSNSTLYYAYAYWDGAAVKIELSTTGQSVLGTYGQVIKTGDQSRTFVGIIHTTAAGEFVDSETQRFCVSFFNRVYKPCQRVGLGGNRSTASVYPTWAELSSADRVEFINFEPDVKSMSKAWFSGGVNSTLLGGAMFGAVGIDGVTPIAQQALNEPVAAYAMNISGQQGVQPAAVTYHYLTLIGAVSGVATETWAGAFTNFGIDLWQ